MVRYEVRVLVRTDLASAFEAYMREKHLPEILATGCFRSIRFEQDGDMTFRSCYEARSQTELDQYLTAHTGHFREDFLAHFPEGCEVRREVWNEVQTYVNDASGRST